MQKCNRSMFDASEAASTMHHVGKNRSTCTGHVTRPIKPTRDAMSDATWQLHKRQLHFAVQPALLSNLFLLYFYFHLEPVRPPHPSGCERRFLFCTPFRSAKIFPERVIKWHAQMPAGRALKTLIQHALLIFIFLCTHFFIRKDYPPRAPFTHYLLRIVLYYILSRLHCAPSKISEFNLGIIHEYGPQWPSLNFQRSFNNY